MSCAPAWRIGSCGREESEGPVQLEDGARPGDDENQLNLTVNQNQAINAVHALFLQSILD